MNRKKWDTAIELNKNIRKYRIKNSIIKNKIQKPTEYKVEYNSIIPEKQNILSTPTIVIIDNVDTKFNCCECNRMLRYENIFWADKGIKYCECCARKFNENERNNLLEFNKS